MHSQFQAMQSDITDNSNYYYRCCYHSN